MKEDKEYYELEVCTEKSFTNDNDHKKAYWDIWMKGEGENSFLCFKKEDLDKIVMQGTYESRFLKKDHSYWVYEIDRCTDFEGKELLDYPPCASN
jgi:hypothetical protein